MEDFRKTAIEAAREAGKYIFAHIGKLKEISHKGGINNLVTDVDKASEKMIVERITGRFPDHSILAEEGGRRAGTGNGGFQWVIDPLDGTVNYAHGFPFFCVSIALAHKGDVTLGVVFDPVRDELFTAEKAKGAFLNGEKIGTSGTKELQSSLIATGFAYNVEEKVANADHFRIMLTRAQAVRRAGSAALDLCYVACGRLDGFWEFGLSPWDTAAGQLVVREAGGEVTLLNGGEFDISKKEIAATNGAIHQEMLSSLAGK